MRIKICGITRHEDALAAFEAGADAIGLVFYAKSPRAVSVQQAKQIIADLPESLCIVGLFVNAQQTVIESIIRETAIDMLQFHGEETDAQCQRLGMPYVKAIRVQGRDTTEEQIQQHPHADALLFDSYVADAHGGTGQVFDWSNLPEKRTKPLILAGGLKPDNVRHAIESARPDVVDVSGGVEQSKGVKDPARIRSFVTEVNHVAIR